MPEPRLYHLLQIAAHRLRKHGDALSIEAAGVSAAQAGAMFVIEASPGIPQRGVARALGQNESAVTTMVARLQAAGLITRTQDAEDSRIWRLDLTDAGRSALDRVRGVLDRINDRLGGVLDTEERLALADMLARLAEVDWEG